MCVPGRPLFSPARLSSNPASSPTPQLCRVLGRVRRPSWSLLAVLCARAGALERWRAWTDAARDWEGRCLSRDFPHSARPVASPSRAHRQGHQRAHERKTKGRMRAVPAKHAGGRFPPLSLASEMRLVAFGTSPPAPARVLRVLFADDSFVRVRTEQLDFADEGEGRCRAGQGRGDACVSPLSPLFALLLLISLRLLANSHASVARSQRRRTSPPPSRSPQPLSLPPRSPSPPLSLPPSRPTPRSTRTRRRSTTGPRAPVSLTSASSGDTLAVSLRTAGEV